MGAIIPERTGHAVQNFYKPLQLAAVTFRRYARYFKVWNGHSARWAQECIGVLL